jgi:hypothetical protein
MNVGWGAMLGMFAGTVVTPTPEVPPREDTHRVNKGPTGTLTAPT